MQRIAAGDGLARTPERADLNLQAICMTNHERACQTAPTKRERASSSRILSNRQALSPQMI